MCVCVCVYSVCVCVHECVCMQSMYRMYTVDIVYSERSRKIGSILHGGLFFCLHKMHEVNSSGGGDSHSCCTSEVHYGNRILPPIQHCNVETCHDRFTTL